MSATMTSLGRPGTGTLLARARLLGNSGRLEGARPLLAAARRLGADPDAADLIEAGLLVRAGELGRALALLDAAVLRSPARATRRRR